MAQDKKNQQEAITFVKLHHIGVLATVSPDGKPQAATITYFVDNDFNLYFITRSDTRKYENLKYNKRVAIVIGADASSPMTAQLEGVVAFLNDSEVVELTRKSEEAGMKASYWWPVLQIPGGEFIAVRVKVDWFRWLNVDLKSHPATFSRYFHQIISK